MNNRVLPDLITIEVSYTVTPYRFHEHVELELPNHAREVARLQLCGLPRAQAAAKALKTVRG